MDHPVQLLQSGIKFGIASTCGRQYKTRIVEAGSLQGTLYLDKYFYTNINLELNSSNRRILFCGSVKGSNLQNVFPKTKQKTLHIFENKNIFMGFHQE